MEEESDPFKTKLVIKLCISILISLTDIQVKPCSDTSSPVIKKFNTNVWLMVVLQFIFLSKSQSVISN